VNEVDGEHRRDLRMQELPPRRVDVPFRRWRDPQDLEDLADRGGADPMAELEHLVLDPLIPPGTVLGGEPLDQGGDFRR
jgi:hypothetical protein